MGKKLKNLKWESVALEGLSAEDMTKNFEGFLGLEECTDYGLDVVDVRKKDQKKKKAKKEKTEKRKAEPSENIKEIAPSKKVCLSNGFTVETCNSSKPSLTNEEKTIKTEKSKPIDPKVSVVKEKPKKKQKIKLGENITAESDKLTLEDMQSWLQFQIPDEILKALGEQGFKMPTKIQELTLPAAMHGRRDILGAAETGSGKTLAFGIPILAGIMKLKEQAKAGIDVYELPYKKSSAKKIKVIEEKPKKKTKNKQNNTEINKKKKQESSEEGYSSDSDNDQSDDNDEADNNDDVKSDVDESNEKSDEEFLEEYDVPLRKKESSGDEGNDSDYDVDKYVHLSDMVDSDDFNETTDEEASDLDDDVLSKVNDESGSEDDGSGDETRLDEESGGENESDQEEVDEENQGIGCVKVIDDIEMPGHEVTKTGKPLYALILTPTRELAIQISRHLISAAKYTGIRIATVVGGMASVKQERVLSKGPEVVVATPGRLWELMRTRETHLEQVDNIKFLAIDETDRMVERNHFEELHPLLERINSDENKKNSRQNFVFSATLTMVHDLPTHMKGKKVTKRGKIINRKLKKMTPEQKIKKLVDLIGMTDPKVVDITTQNLGTAETLTECRIVCSLEEKDYYLHYVLKQHPGRTIVFCNSIGSVRRLAQLFGLLNCHPLPLHASMPQRQRLKNLERFRDEPHGVLVATDVAARGLDIPDVEHVIHYQVPRTAENYVHRSGRTARANKEGLTILMMEPGEAFLYSKLYKTLNRQTELPSFPVPAHILSSMRATVTLAREVDRLQLAQRRAAQEQGWLDRAARDMDMVVDEDFVQVKHKDTKATKQYQVKKKQLEAMLSKPLFPKGFSFKYPSLNTDAMNVNMKTEGNALQVMKNAIKTGAMKKAKRTSKNAPLLKLVKTLSNNK